MSKREKAVAALVFLVLCVVGTVVLVIVAVEESPRERVRHYLPIIERNSTRFGVPVNLVQAVIVAESSARSRAVSPRGALGLMQLMPATARELAGKLGHAKIVDSDCFDPELNIELGTFYLGQLLRDFKDDVTLALAAYNAGPTRVKEWQRSAGRVSGEEVLRLKGFSETKVYVRRVLELKEDFDRGQ
ncbi:MAG: lytic transglycosylase domain-containing protein [Planctomycetota bacterium]|nr:lytic transglycosylase domain-containing protein [Planctomycetota bacterium]